MALKLKVFLGLKLFSIKKGIILIGLVGYCNLTKYYNSELYDALNFFHK